MENRKDQYKLYKSGKLWITATVAVVLFNASVTVVSADDGKTTEQSSLVQNDKDVALVSENPSDNQTSMAVDDTEIVSAVESAESVGVVVKQEPTRSNIVSDSENTEDIAKVKNDIASDYEQQIAELQNAEKTQQQNNQQFNQHTEEYESALHKGKQQNKDGKTQIATSAAKQALDFDTSKPADESSPTSNIEPSKICTGIGSHSNLSDSTKVWEYVGPQVLNATIEKTWSRSGSIEDADGNKRSVDFHEIFHDFQLQNGNWNDTNNYKESGIPHLAISSNAVDNIRATNLNWQTTFWFTYSDSHEVVPISKVPGSNEEPKVYFLSGSLSSTNFAGPEWDNWNGNRKEYVQTNDAKTAIINEQSTIGLDYISADGIADNAPDGLAYVNTSADFQSPNWDENTNPQHYAIEEGVSFTDFTTDKPTLYIGAVPMNKNARWWHENHNMNSDELAFLKKPEKIDPVTVTYHLNTITYEKNNNIQPLVAEITDADPEVHQENEVSNDTRTPENNQKGYGAATSPALTESSVKNQSEVTVHYVLKRINGKELQSTQTIKGTSGQSYYDEVGNFISNNSDEDVTTYEIPETFNQEVAGITNSNDGLLHYTYTADGNGGVFTEQKNISNPKQNVWVIYTYSVDGKNGQDGKDGVNGIDGQNGVDGKNGVNGIDGQNGVDGKDGVNGIDGQNGIDGKDGVNGIDGKNGVNGIDGQNGVDGKDGVNGIDGQNGVDGKDGVNGEDGQNGVDGKDGVNGIDGQNGVNGKDGQNGVDGKNGVNGIDGQNGVDGQGGKNGVNGIDGQNGVDGKDGVNGINGQNGVDGKDGVNGIDGQNGVDGKDGVNGINGQNGVDGKDGVNGLDGQNGVDGKDGVNGIDGQNGIDGKNGVNGIDGQNGVDGKDGVNGKDGQNGVDGKNGVNGINGQNGVDGKSGVNGKDGQNGVDGKNGVNGIDGQNGVDGKNGVNGKDGQNGVDGKNGVNGIDGQNGVDGKDGVNGKDGQNGVDGKDGINGIDGQNGVDGKNGVNGIDGQNGVDGKDGVNGIDGQNGVDGKDGVNGINGQNGVDGKDGVNGIDGKNSLNNQEASNSIEDKDVADSIDTKKGRDNTENFKSNTLSTSKTSGDAIEEMIVKEECSPTENNNQVQEKQVSANDADNVPNQGLESYYQADHNSDQSTFSADQLKKNDLAAIIGETSSYHKSEQNQNEGKTLHTDNLESKDNANDVVSQKDIEKQKINQSKNNGLQLPKTNGQRYFASALEAFILAMLLIISKLYKKIRI
ncbi:KxYKxGKxW signal peptide domain-containing protein [Leuconostoc mesenteroides]|uniref:KxYKxGKxW signal peptide domain-containing protein n=1 Tax=Leuconostoc mesenteroides TaxID=1245 RepID=UPI002073C0DE|nr:KxYKxGKxW signal peptide domain-containing protein [Leuconostoc mesenteroides]MCM6827204.1 KxYKxGKxW signal peptide domain-containing protein [Leuconostoc mesenteroides]